MTPRDVIELLTLDQRSEIASVCMETMEVSTLWDLIQLNFSEDELLEIGLRIRQEVAV